ncbi:CLUMA_CG004759, isoform A [Clunio marinus]|uniref:CLUMA_CG004759, isoform A n=1 Tax=Clunio marinus TaxID=568069 RepID=A0A1J1HSN6_9DIPT|nr:CLUMA_CG004759, isoform A [Clunio marinus]
MADHAKIVFEEKPRWNRTEEENMRISVASLIPTNSSITVTQLESFEFDEIDIIPIPDLANRRIPKIAYNSLAISLKHKIYITENGWERERISDSMDLLMSQLIINKVFNNTSCEILTLMNESCSLVIK